MSYNEWLDNDVLEDYLDGKLDAKTMYKVERLSLEDPFVAEALAGLSESPRRNQSLSLLQKQLQERIAQKPIEKKRWTITSQRLSIGAAAAVLFVTASVLFWMKESSQPKINSNAPKNVQIKVAPEVPSKAVEPTPLPNLEADKAVVVAKVNSKTKNNIPAIATKPSVTVASAAPQQPILSDEVAQAEARQESIAKVMAAEKREQESKAIVASSLASKVAGVQINAASSKSINGRVVSLEDGLPIPGAAVKLTNGNASTTTDVNGEFTLSVDSGVHNQKLDIRYIGYNSKNVSASVNQNLVVALEPDTKSLSEVVVTRSNPTKAKRSSVNSIKVTPQPEGGWDNFELFLKNNNRLFKGEVSTKSVTLSFEILNERPSQIKIVKGLTKAENEEAIRLVSAGPNWVIPANSSTKMQLVIKF
ncbi:carboxypeptidase-like regulatory domain-containing protein [Pedobacter boryungensis]|uniref:Carboxypeptidase-like regulatory domain-containing protein n=1 Tax=Pedobacter boryungensis TaxID=869962 RepID=A0ABX2DEU4_9SPHI|nr:carboxypeptidase-like regulatory domain-containing protein [Pedobacter boryungensis]NQX31806.1 carboxypeptidase-like regulatory domain-containing protein [Pedobacter boryungensis]